ncbi:beta-phosphoglucomutase [Cellulosilyticum sp. I15G10I2]|uniref:beta-phosphoglucomutase n=1 Tax=Cellulosilyticum sp. I15G10I2 TaxID=1892843 RepID=UPI00085C3790|nr:beta-phosphoglucomutase [Cellulosilyticum sp. I15G10I2]
MHKKYKAAIFDLDGVLVDTAKYHFLAWNQIAGELGIAFTEKDNERLKGVSRMASLNILLNIGGRDFTDDEKRELADRKNKIYVAYILKLTQADILPGVIDLLENLRGKGIQTAIGSASKNTPIIIERLGIQKYFQAISDGNIITKAKPDPEVFIKAADMLGVAAKDCVVFEDAKAGVQAAKNADMYTVGVGKKKDLPGADIWVASLCEIDHNLIF